MSTVSELTSKKISDTQANVRNWGRLVYNVREYGLVGDGVTDDTEKLQELIDLAISEGRKTIAFNAGVYYVTHLVNDDQVFFVGDNASFTGGYSGAIEQLGEMGVTQSEFDALKADVTQQFGQVDVELASLETSKASKDEVNDLASEKADKTYVDAELSNKANLSLLDLKVDKGGNEQVTWGMLDQETKMNMTGDNTPVVGTNAVNTTNIVNNAVTSPKRTVLGDMAILSPQNGNIDFDFTNNQLVFPPGNTNVIWRNKVYQSFSAGFPPLPLELPGGSARGAIYFNTVTNSFAVYDTAGMSNTTENEVFVGVFWTTGLGAKTAYLSCKNYTVNGKSPFYDDILSVIHEEHKGIEPYFIAEITDTVNKVQDITLAPSLVLTMITDSHADDIQYFDRSSRNIVEVNKYIKSDAVMHLGDLVDGNDPIDQTKDVVRDVAKGLLESGSDVFVALGNHDDNTYGDGDRIDGGLWYGLTQRQSDNSPKVHREGNKAYYYVDYEKLNIRMIVLNSSDGADGKTWWGFSLDQTEWLGNVALDTPDDYSVIVCCHMPTRAELNYASADNIHNGGIIEGILEAYNQKSTYSTYDFTSKTNVEIVGYFYGHTHGDSVLVPIGMSFPYISIACSLPNKQSSSVLPVGSVAPDRTVGTVTEDCWDVMVLRRDERKIYMTRFGAGNDRVIDY